MSIDKIEKIKHVGGKTLKQAPQLEPNKDYFEALMRQKRVEPDPALTIAKNEEAIKTHSLFDEVRQSNRRPDQTARSSPDDLVAQATDVVSQIDLLKTKLETPDLQVKGSVQTLLRNKLTHIDESLQVALDKAGIEYVAPAQSDGMSKPLDRFLGMLTHSQNQLETLAGDVARLSAQEHSLAPADMLLIQIKVGQIQQEVELFTSMLNKALESTKTIMNVQV